MPNPRLLVTAGKRVDLEPALVSRLPGVEIGFPDGLAAGPSSGVEAWLVGSVDRELPGWTPSMTPGLRFVQRLYTGLDDFPFHRFPDTVAIAGNVGAYAPFVAEHALALLLALGHDLPRSMERVRTGQLRPPPSSRFMFGRTVLVLGFGAIGHELARSLHALGARVEAVSRRGDPDAAADQVYDPSRLGDAVAAADAIVDCRPLTRATRGSIDGPVLARLKPDAIFVNVGRAATVDETALYEHARTHPEFRVGLDVWWEEDFEHGTLGSRFPIATLTNVLGTPHSAAIGGAAHRRAIEFAAENLARFFRGERPWHLADRADYAGAPSRG